MTHRPETEHFLDDVERYVNKKFTLRDDIGTLYELSQDRSMKQLFGDILFSSKFITHASTILQRSGVSSDETQKLSVEFKTQVEKISTLLRTIVKEAHEDVKQRFRDRYFSLSHESMSALLVLLRELSWIKNYELDKERAA